jgi:hypothetical protein
MNRKLATLLIALALAAASGAGFAQSTAATVAVPAPAPAVTAPAPAPVAAAPVVRALPPMQFYSSIGDDTLYDLLKAKPAFAGLDKELSGTPLFLLVTHTVKPTSGGAAAAGLSAILAGSTLGIIPIVTNEEFVVRYEIWMHGEPIATYSFSRTKTRAINMWSAGGSDKYYGLGKDGFEWLKSTADEFAVKAAQDPEMTKVQAEIEFYFPAAAPAATAPAATAAPAAK